MMGPHDPLCKKLCFITIGATASFDSLIAAALNPQFLKALRAAGYTDLLLQHGKEGGKIFEDFIVGHRHDSPGRYGLNINGFDFNKKGLGWEMKAAKGDDGATEGVVISHAGMHYPGFAVYEQENVMLIDEILRLRIDPRCSSHPRAANCRP